MIRVLFICHGNICRSPMCEFIFRDKVQKLGLGEQFHIESAATSTEEIGNMPASWHTADSVKAWHQLLWQAGETDP